ncbi:TetR/AcrR family transcriptional regulator [Micromonospora sp. AMSO31t]|uniref:TetR/AcrR family transcriptional regulator n=1 Tax=Micromonospora sp. AMSO31t TaxID=2650566 RepID=UPI001CED77E1|nr:TetR/AcrR family transcriptional regulator [Micromonospora sp. AMSO31t]
MPARGDHDARRADVSAAVWRVLAARGFGGLTLRAVAAEMGVSTGLLTHYFPNKRALVRHAVDVAERHTDARDRHAAAGEGRPALRAALLDVLPLTDEATAMSRVWVSYWDGALADDEFAADQRRRYDRWRARLRSHVDAALAGAGTDPEALVATCAAFAHGLVVQALFDPAAFPADRQVALLDRFLADLFPA